MPSSFTDLAGDDSHHHHHQLPCPLLLCSLCCYGHGSSHYSNGRRSNMGPLGDSLGLSTGTAMWLAVAQLPVLMGLALHYPTVRLDVFSTGVRLALDPADNATSVIAAPDKSAIEIVNYEHGLGISGLYVLNAAAVTFFAVLSMNLLDRGFAAAAMMGEMEERIRMSQAGGSMVSEEKFITQNVGMIVDPTFRMWNQVSCGVCCFI